MESTEKKASHLLGLRGGHQYSDQRSNRNIAPCEASTTVGTEGKRTKWPDRQIVSVNRAADGRWQRGQKIIDGERKEQGQEQILAEHLDGLEKSDFCDFERNK